MADFWLERASSANWSAFSISSFFFFGSLMSFASNLSFSDSLKSDSASELMASIFANSFLPITVCLMFMVLICFAFSSKSLLISNSSNLLSISAFVFIVELDALLLLFNDCSFSLLSLLAITSSLSIESFELDWLSVNFPLVLTLFDALFSPFTVDS